MSEPFSLIFTHRSTCGHITITKNAINVAQLCMRKELSPAVSQWLQSYNTNNSERIKNWLRTWHKPASLDCFSLNTALSRLPQRRASLILFFGMRRFVGMESASMGEGEDWRPGLGHKAGLCPGQERGSQWGCWISWLVAEPGEKPRSLRYREKASLGWSGQWMQWRSPACLRVWCSELQHRAANRGVWMDTENLLLIPGIITSFFGGSGVWAQGFGLPRQVLYYLSHASSPFVLRLFLRQGLTFELGMTCVCHHDQLFLFRGESLLNFLPGLASNHNPLDLHLLRARIIGVSHRAWLHDFYLSPFFLGMAWSHSFNPLDSTLWPHSSKVLGVVVNNADYWVPGRVTEENFW
jgi:hypothetical protein